MKPFTSLFLLAVLASSSLSAEQREMQKTQQSLDGMSVSYLVEPAIDGKIVLDANNGFFDREAFRAEEQRPAPADDKVLISSHFGKLIAQSSGGTARWHLWIPNAGQVEVNVAMSVPEAKARTRWSIKLGGQTQEFDGGAISHPLRFSVDAAGKQTLELKCVTETAAPNAEIRQLELTGSAARGAGLMRARWRPAAIHTQFKSSTCEKTQLWVFESQSLGKRSSYSPMSTQFGYFGASFAEGGTAAGGVNFSMWAANRSATKAPPLNTMPHLLATGNRNAVFGGFGHEGSGVKIRDWEPYDHHPKSVIQALRVQSDGDWNTFSGYLYDEREERWVLYAMGRKSRTSSKRRSDDQSVALRATSFCEIPGPPSRQRSGDEARTIRRRGWFYGAENRWHKVDRQTTRYAGQPTNKYIGAEDGWLTMTTGGMEMVKTPETISLPESDAALPTFLQPDRTAELFQVPVTFERSQVIVTDSNSAKVTYSLSRSGTNASAVLHYGPSDCLTFVKRELHGTEKRGVSNAMLSADRTWARATSPQSVDGNRVTFHLRELRPATQYYYRALVTNEEGKCWALETGSFKTK